MSPHSLPLHAEWVRDRVYHQPRDITCPEPGMRAAELQLGTELYSVAADPRDDAASVRLLLAQGAEPNWRMPGVGSTPLIAAAGAGCHRVVAALLEAASDVNLSNRSGATAVYAACERGHRLCLKTLLTASPDVEFATHDGATPLGAAASNGDEQMVRLLLKLSDPVLDLR